ncbi:MAG: DNA polymerase Y family protein [Pseudomonadota bacterium]|nr:DNA polymerase Y family protein [Pseudomonadota bacterium]
MRWLCILFPQLALDAVLRSRDDPTVPLALLSGPPQRRVLQAVNESAREQGLRSGQSLTQARTLLESFDTVEHDPSQTEYWQQFLASWAYGFSGHVSLDFPRTLLLEVASSLRLFGPWPELEQRLRAELQALGFQHRLVLAPTPLAARVLANVADGLAVDELALQGELQRLPVARSGLPSELVESLQRMGLRRLQQVLELPRDGLAKRFPPQLLAHLDQLQGHHPLALSCYQPPDHFRQRIEFNFDVESTTSLLFPLRRLIGDLATFLAGRDCGVQRFVLLLEHRRQPASEVAVGLLGAERDGERLFELARGRLERLELAAPVQALTLLAEDLPRFVPAAAELFSNRPQQSQSWLQVCERLRARLGDKVVQPLAAVDEHRPERSWLAQERGDAAARPAGPRPGWLLAEPVLLNDLFPRVLAGPERIESGWWDGDDVRRDYYLIETRDGRRAWAFHAAGRPGPFWVHGWFA